MPRNQEGLALIGDPRNDVHLFVNQLHVAFLRAHNLLVDRLREDGVPEAEIFEEARRATMWHYQWILLHDYLPALIGDELATELADDGPALLRDRAASPTSRSSSPTPRSATATARSATATGSTHAERRAADVPRPDGLRRRAARARRRLVRCSSTCRASRPRSASKRMDGRLPASLINLPAQITGDVDDEAYHSLAARDLQRGQAIGLPSGEAIARYIGAEPLDPADIGLASHGWRDETPLWFYILREADVVGDGDRLGPVGGRIVGEVLVGLLTPIPSRSARSTRAGGRRCPPPTATHYSLADLLAIGTHDGRRMSQLHAPGHDRPRRHALEHRGLLGVPAHRRLVGAPPRVHDLRRGRLLRQLAEQARDGAPPCHEPPDHPLARARRELVLVLRGRGRVRGARPALAASIVLPQGLCRHSITIASETGPARGGGSNAAPKASDMPIINIKFIKDVVATEEQKAELIVKMTDTFVGVLGDVVRPFTYCIIDEVPVGLWGIAGVPMPDLAYLVGDELAEVIARSRTR